MFLRASCPYCNTAFGLPEVPASGRVTCPRCGDAFPARGRVTEADPGGPEPAPSPPSPVRPPRRAPAVVLGLGLLGLLAGVGFYFLRDRSDAGPPVDPGSLASAPAVPPAELTGLAYLPANANLAFAARPGPVLEYAARTNQDPAGVQTAAGVPAGVLGALGRAGLTLQEIDHVAGGVHLPDADLGDLRAAVALVLRRPVADEDRFLDQLGAKRVAQAGTTRYTVDRLGLPLRLAKASPTVWLFGWQDRDLEPAGGPPAGVRELVAEKVQPDAAVWAVAADARWADKPTVRLLVGQFGRKEWLPVLGKGRAVAVGLTAGESPRVRAFVRCADAGTGEQLRAYFAAKAAGDATRTGGAGEWAMFDAPADPRAGFGVFKAMLDDAK